MIKQVRANYNAPEIEKEIQAYWNSEKAYEKTKELRSKGEDFYFVDGPPYTTGAIHLGTAMNKTIKDTLIRYWRMKGYNVRDQPGFDMHGLPIEVQKEKELDVHSKKEIEEKIGIDNFVKECRQMALTRREEMTAQFKQLGVWMDWDNPYQTLKPEYLEAAWWTISRANERGLLELSDRVHMWCPRCETALAEAEIEYWDENDPSIMVKFPVIGDDCSLLIWTTTPWTLPGNMAVAVHPDFDYVKVELSGPERSEKLIILESQIENVMKKGKFEKSNIIKKMKGKDLEGTPYSPPFEIEKKYLKESEWMYKVVTATYVENDNTGLVHTAPGFGPDDYDTGKRYGIAPFCPVGEGGRYTEEFAPMAGKKVKTCNDPILEILKEKNLLYSSEKIKHRYGHCWRCKSPIIYRNTSQWFIKIPQVKQKMLDEVDRVKWVPDWAGSTREKNWVDGARDWCISRQRYWGIPIPVWQCSCGERRVVGKYDELKDGEGYAEGMDTHRPWIDGVTFKCKKCGGTMTRVKDVLDVWFDSGVAAWADLGWPSNEEEMKKWWPGRFIVEAHDQTRGWFYSQLASGVISFDRAPYDEVMMHGWVLDSKGQKMSKSLGNVVEPLQIIKDVGADSLRFYLLEANAPWEDTAFQKDGPKDARKVLNTLWNVVNFASTYMNIDGYDPEKHILDSVMDSLRDEDLWMLSKTEKMKRDVEAYLETRELHKMTRALDDYILEDLSRWYVRLVRDRTWTEDEDQERDKNASYFTLHYAIMSTVIALAPTCPHISEEIYQHMDGKLLSVHMEDWPCYNASLINDDLEYSMKLIQDIVEIIAAERQKMGSKLRWPLKALTIKGDEKKTNDSVKVFEHVLSQQGNIKSILYTEKSLDASDKITEVSFGPGMMYIDFEVTPEIEAEGYARELIRRIQQMRKDMKLNVEQFVNCEVKAEPHLVELFETWKDHISGEVRAKSVVFTDSPSGDEVKTWDVTGKDIVIGISSIDL